MAIRNAQAVWEGSLQQGKGTVSLGSGAFEGEYSFASRFEDGTGTNPEELIAAAEAGCFSMALGANLGKADQTVTRIATTADVHINKTDSGWEIQRIDLRTEVEGPSLSDDEFQKIAEETKQTCPVSRALSAIAITLEAKLIA